jgi:lipoprotein NlpD
MSARLHLLRIGGALVIALAACCSNAAPAKQPSPNFYSDDAKPATSARHLDKTPASRPAEKTPTAKTKTATAQSRKPSVPKATATPKPATTAAKSSPAKTGALSKEPTVSKPRPKTFRGDVYGLAVAVTSRWNFFEMLPTEEELASLRMDSLRKKAGRLSQLFDAVARAAEQRQQNVQRLAATAYLLQATSSAQPCYFTGSNLTAAHQAVIRSSLRRDALELETVLNSYAKVREASNAASQQVADAAAKGSMPQGTWFPSHVRPLTATEVALQPYGVTEDLGYLARQRSVAILAARVPDVDELRAVLEAEALLRQEEKRESLRSFAPEPPRPSPEYNPLIDPSTPMPTDVGTKHSRPDEAPVLERPATNAVVLPANAGAPVLAAADGTVAFVGEIRGYGSSLIVQHANDLFSVYGYLSAFECAEGDQVKGGQPIARAGSIPGTHTGGIRFEVRRGRQSVPVNALLGKTEPANRLVGR